MSEARSRTIWRRLGYRLAPGDALFSVPARPGLHVILALHCGMGFLLASGYTVMLGGGALRNLLWVLLLWVLFLNTGWPVLMVAGQALAFLLLPLGFAIAYAACLVLIFAPAVPSWVRGVIGFGVLGSYAGWAATGRPLDDWYALVLGGFGLLIAVLQYGRRRGMPAPVAPAIVACADLVIFLAFAI